MITSPEKATPGQKSRERRSPRSAPIRTAQQLAAVFEQTIKEHPEDWHMLQRVFVVDLDRERLKSTRNGTADANPDAKADP